MSEEKKDIFKVGRPPMYETAEELQAQIKDYFDNGVKKRKVEVGRAESKQVIEIPIPTITGLVLHCGFDSRQSFYDYEAKELFTYTIKKARTFIEQEYEEQIHMGSTAAIFALKNFGWQDKVINENTGAVGVATLTVDEYKETRKKMIEQDDC